MKYLPITLIATLSASLVVALFFTPTLGALLGKASPVPHDERAKDTGPYMRTVRFALHRPGLTLTLAVALLFVVQTAYGKFGRGVEFFPSVEPDYGQVIVHARGNLSLDEKDRLMGEVEKHVLDFPGVKTVYTRVGEQPRGIERDHRGHRRRHPVRVRRLAHARRRRTRSWTRSAPRPPTSPASWSR